MDKRILLITSVALLGMGTIYSFFPNFFFSMTGTELTQPGSLTDVRATYGGFQLGLGLFLLIAALRKNVFTEELFLLFLVFLTLFIVRTYGLSVDIIGDDDPENATHFFNYGAVVFELVCAGFFFMRYQKSKSADTSQ